MNASYDGIPLLDAPLYNNAVSLVVAKLDSSGNMLWRKAIKNYSNYPVMLANNCLKIIGDTSIVFFVQYMNLARNDHSYFLYYLDTLVRVPQNELFESFLTLFDSSHGIETPFLRYESVVSQV